jgi:uncharacterized membrane protein YqjE
VSTSGSTSGGEPYRLAEPDKSLGSLVGELSKDFGDLVSTHIALAKVETKEEIKKAGKGAGMMAGAAVAGLLALILLSFAAAWGLAAVMPNGLAFLIVGVVWTAITAALALMGRKEFQDMEPMPEQTVEELKEDRRWLNEQKS